VNFYRTTLRHIPEGILKPVSEPGYFVASWWRTCTPLRHPPKVTIDQ
jgi:hypothetical protein